jgi:hypothetical protein
VYVLSESTCSPRQFDGPLLAVSGCTAPNSTTGGAHRVTVYLGDRSETRDEIVSETDKSGETLVEGDDRVSDSNEADEDAPSRRSERIGRLRPSRSRRRAVETGDTGPCPSRV